MSMYRVFSCVVGRGCLLWPMHFLGKTQVDKPHTHTHTHRRRREIEEEKFKTLWINDFEPEAIRLPTLPPPGPCPGRFQRHLIMSENISGCKTGKVLWSRILINIPQSTGKPPTPKTYPCQNINSAKVEKHCFLFTACVKNSYELWIHIWIIIYVYKLKDSREKGEWQGYFCLQISVERILVWVKSGWR